MKHLTTLLLLLISSSVNAFLCSETKIIEHTFAADDYSEVELKALAGELEVSCTDDSEIYFRGEVCTDNTHHLDMIDVDLIKKDGKLTIVAIIPYHQDDFDPSYASMDIELRLPKTLPVHLRDSSGDMQVENASVRSINDSSGDIRVLNGMSELSLRDSSGNMLVRGLIGNVIVSDSSGDIDLRRITGDVNIDGDSSGNIDVKDVHGSVTVNRDSSGDIESVTEDVLIGSDGSGDITIEEVSGGVRIEADGSGGIEVGRVVGNYFVGNKGSGEINTFDIDGEIDTPR